MTETHLRQSIERLRKRLDTLKAWNPESVRKRFHSPELDALSASIDEALARTFGSHSDDYNRYQSAFYFNQGSISLGGGDIPLSRLHSYLTESKAENVALLQQAIDSLEERLSELRDSPAISHMAQASQAPQEPSDRVFIVHGHDKEAKEAVARLLMKLKLEPIILHEQPNMGRTIIEKFEAEGNVGFAVVLLTPDDLAKAKDGSDLRARARQNVVLELGYFVGSLGRAKVCTLVRGDLELPSDFAGVVYEKFDDGGAWKFVLGRELRAAGYQIDMNQI